ncbi:hypothetical protein KDK95_26265 [Actinospica sp. MGRD01-02]|uniref:Uncharacterized protein n=1 Tax=Actinospica acidithermotolerans TaxID=2828514 RepID=A0A941EG21_9ACTN|nr:hypothetical protein [Actinospica acidithermotolerans]MBR7829837.1 hypothetical protein [Actinospica acidithermotolerans]
MIVIVVLIALLVGGIALLKYQGAKASTPAHIDVQRLSLERITEIGSRSAGLIGSRTRPGGAMDRIVSRAAVRRRGDGTAEWDVRSGAGVMSFRVEQRPNGLRVIGAATRQTPATRNSAHGGIWGLSSAIWNAVCRALGIPKSPGRLLAQRRRVFAAIARADSGSREPVN